MTRTNKNSLRVSVNGNIVDDLMNVILHDNDMPFLEGTIKDKRTVIFRSPTGVEERDDGMRVIQFSDISKEYDFDEVKRVLLEFIELMENIENITPI